MMSLGGSADGMRRAATAMTEAATRVHTEAGCTAEEAAKASQDLGSVTASIELLARECRGDFPPGDRLG